MPKGKKRYRSFKVPHHRRKRSKEVRDLAIFADVSYTRKMKDKDKKLDLHFGENRDWIIDPLLTDRLATVYINPVTKQVVTSFKGTSDLKDLFTDVHVAVGSQKNTTHFKRSDKRMQLILDTFPTFNHTLSAHSLGGTVNLALHEKYGDQLNEVHNFNPGSGLGAALGKLKDGTTEESAPKKVHQHFIEGDFISSIGRGDPDFNNHYYDPLPGSTNPHTIQQFLE